MRNRVRFWTWINDGPVRITLEEGQTLHWREAHETEEGYSFQSLEWTFDGDQIELVSVSGGRDCDGRIEDCRELFVPAVASELYHHESGNGDDIGILYPNWDLARSEVFDEYARMAGY